MKVIFVFSLLIISFSNGWDDMEAFKDKLDQLKSQALNLTVEEGNSPRQAGTFPVSISPPLPGTPAGTGVCLEVTVLQASEMTTLLNVTLDLGNVFLKVLGCLNTYLYGNTTAVPGFFTAFREDVSEYGLKPFEDILAVIKTMRDIGSLYLKSQGIKPISWRDL